MRITLIALLLLLVAASFGVASEKFARVDQNLDVPSFVGWDNERVIVVLKSNIAIDHVRDKMSDQALANYPGFEPLLRRFEVARSVPQFVGADRKAGGSVLAHHYKVIIGNGTVEEAKAAFERNPNVERVELIGLHTMYATPNDTYYQGYPNPDFPYDQWHYWDTKSIDADQAWDSNAGDATVVVGILDSGTRYFHLDLGGNSALWGPDNPFAGGNIFINPGEIPGDGVDNDGNGYIDDVIGYDFIESAGGPGLTCIDQDCGTKDNDPDDGNGHGTHTSGTVGAITNNARQVAGVAGGFSDGTTTGTGNGVKIVPCRMGYHASYRGQTTGIVDMAAAAEAMYYMADLVDAGHNVAAVNCSWGSSNSGGLEAAANFLLSRDVIIVVAAGNSNSTSSSYLGGRGDCLDVAATDQAGDGASFTNYGSWVDVAAPGVDILSTYANPDDPDLTAHYISIMSGTSMSAPHVVGIAALLESCNPSLSGPDKFSLIVNNTIPYNDTRDLGSGIANANLALAAASCATCTEITPVADFSGTPTSGEVPLAVNYTDLSTNNPTSWSWTFGDGGSSTAQNPSYTYSTTGTYTVTLTASNCAGSDVASKVDYITVTDPPCTETTPVADFSGSPTSGEVPLTVNFSDLSTNNPDTWSWGFGDGGTSTAQNPSYTYSTTGTYTVTLTASNCAGSDVASKVDYITVTDPPCTEIIPVADFSGSPTSGDAPLTVTFSDLSTNNPDAWSWDFGDGGTSTAQNPSYTYSTAGTYSVALTASNCAGSNTATKTDYITVTQPPQNEMHVQDISVTRKNAGPNCSGIGTIYVYDSGEQPVANAIVYATATGPVNGTFSGLTGADGSVVFETGKTRDCSGEWCYEVTNVTHASNTYNSTANHVTLACESGYVYSMSSQNIVALPDGFSLTNHPNPFNPNTTVSFSLPNATYARLDVYNIAGQRVATLVDGNLSAGQYSFDWDGTNVASGIYLYRLTTDDFTNTKRMILMK